MADMKWLDEAEIKVRAFETTPECCGIAYDFTEAYGRKLIAAVRLAERSAHRAEKMLDLERITSARLELSGLVTRLRSGEVEEKG